MSAAADPALLPFRRERLLSVGLLALLAPIPLGFSFAVEAGWLALYLCAVALVLLLVVRGRIPCLGLTWQNVAGLCYAFLFYADLRYGSRRLLLATVHLLLFTTAIKLASIRRERDFAVALALVGFLFLASMATAIHSTILLFLFVFTAVAWPTLVRWGLYRELAGAEDEWRRQPRPVSLPGLAATALSLAGTLLVAVPLFALLPRLKAPLVRGMAEGREISTGFAESVDPDLFGILKRSDKVYLRVSADEPITRLGLETLRLRTLAFTKYRGRVWQKPREGTGRAAAPTGSVLALPGASESETLGRRALAIDLLPLESRFLPYPIGSPGVRFGEDTFRGTGMAAVEFDAGRNVLLPMAPDHTIRYDALYGVAPVPDLAPPDGRDSTGEAEGIPAVKEWALRVASGIDPRTDPAGAARAIERVLSTTFRYTLEIPRAGLHPTEDFLFRRKAGHCENFASAMALALREIGIPSRFVTGFAGGQLGFLGRYLIVRGRDAHAWVEAWCGPERGWLSFDPTPAAGRPRVESVPLSQRLRQLGDGAELLYDRYILSFGQSDQMEMFRRMRESSADLAAQMARRLSALQQAGPVFRRGGPGIVLVVGALLLGLLVARNVRRFRSRAFGGARGLPPAAAAYRRLQKILRRRGAALTPASSPAETLAAARAKGAEAPAREIVRIYIASSFGGIPPGDDVAARLDLRLRQIRKLLDARPRDSGPIAALSSVRGPAA